MTCIKRIGWLLIILLQYGLSFYFLLKQKLVSDFSSFYWSAKYYSEGINPYLQITHLSNLPINLNPPFFLESLLLWTELNYQTALLIWTVALFLLGIFGALLTFYLSLPNYFKKYWSVFLLIYLSMYSTMVSNGLGQIGSILLVFIMAGYYFFLKEQEYLAGFFWGWIAAIKLFPALLFIFVLSEKRYTVFWTMVLTCLVAFLLPLLKMGPDIYSTYFKVLDNVDWYQNNWNASLFGYLIRLFLVQGPNHNLLTIKLIYLGISLISLIWYIKKISDFKNRAIPHHAFCLTLLMMLLLSPLGWQYYFSLILMPYTIIWYHLNQLKKIPLVIYSIWMLSLIFINYPSGLILSPKGTLIYQISYYSIYFYGLILLIYLLCHCQAQPDENDRGAKEVRPKLSAPLQISLVAGVLYALSMEFLYAQI
jgi:hypothetical protein